MLSTRSKRKRRRASTESPEPSTDPLEQNKLQTQSSRNGKELFIWEGFREEYIESVEQLPLSLHRSFALLNELDTQAQVYQSGLLPTIREYVKKRQTTVERNGPFKSSNNDTDPRSGLKIRTLEETSRSREPCSPEMHAKAINALSHVQNASEDEERCLKPVRSLPGMAMLLSDLLRASEEKVNLAQAALHLQIDRHVRLLDQAIKEHETQINTDHRTGTGSIAAGSCLRSFSMPNPRGSTRSRNDLDSTGQSPSPFKSHPARDYLHAPSSRRSRRIPAVSTRSAHTFLETSNAETNNTRHSIGQFRLGTAGDKTDAIPFRPSLTANAGPAIVLSSGDMPIDPHEPRYCYCNQVSWGEMIACDADDCEREWFHLGCAGLTEAPKGKSKWYCNACKDRMACGIRKRGH